MGLKYVIILVFLCFATLGVTQKDTILIKRYIEPTLLDSGKYFADTFVREGFIPRNILVGTCKIPNSKNQHSLYDYGISFNKVSKSDCKKSGRKIYSSDNQINSFTKTDSTFIVDITIFENCCNDFLCDVFIDSNGTLDIQYTRYGDNCDCKCCFGLVYQFDIVDIEKFKKIEGVILNRRKKTLLVLVPRKESIEN